MSFKRFVHNLQHSTFIAEDLVVKYLSTNKTDRTITISINGNVYEYEFHDGPIWDVEQRFKKMLTFSQGKALAWIKNQADDYTKLASAPKVQEDVAANSVGAGHIAGAAPGEDPPMGKKAQRKRFAGAAVFEVDHDKVWKTRFGKHPRHRYSKYVGEDDLGNEIRDYCKKNPHESIILQNNKTGEMMFLRRRRQNIKEMTVGITPSFFPRIAAELAHLTGATKGDGKLIKNTDDQTDLEFTLSSQKANFKIDVSVPANMDDKPTIMVKGGKKPSLNIKSDIFFSDPGGAAADIVDSILAKDQGYFDEL